MLRLLRFITLIWLTLALVAVGLAIVIGHTIPAGKQMVGAFPRPDQWTKIALISTNRQLHANRYLPIDVRQMKWSEDGQQLTIMGSRNDRLRLYTLGYSPAENTRRWQVAYSAQFHNFNISPDMRWLVIPGASPADDFAIHQIDSESGFLDLIGVADAVFGGYQPYFQWTEDSQYFIYNPTAYGVDAQGNPVIQPADYQLVNAATGEKHSIAAGTVNNLFFVPGGRYIAYSTPYIPPLPSPNPDDYLMVDSYSVYDLTTKTTRHLLNGQITQWNWSPDGTKFAYLKLVPDPASRSNESAAAAMLRSSIRDPHNGVFIHYTTANMFFGGQAGYNLEMGVIDLNTGETLPIMINQAASYNLIWLPDSTTLLITLYTDSSRFIMSPGASPISQVSKSYLVKLDGSAPIPLALEDEELVIVQAPLQGYQMLLTSSKQSGDFYVMNTTTGAIEPLEMPPGEDYFYSSWSADGHYLAVTTNVRPVYTLTARGGLSPKFTQSPNMLPTVTLVSSVYIAPQQTFRTYLISRDNPTMRLIHEDNIASSLYWSGKGNSLFLNSSVGRQTHIYMLANPEDPNDRVRPLYTGNTGRLTYLFYDSWRPGT